MGERVTIADFAIASLTFNILRNEQGPFEVVLETSLVEFPLVERYTERLKKEMATYLKTRT